MSALDTYTNSNTMTAINFDSPTNLTRRSSIRINFPEIKINKPQSNATPLHSVKIMSDLIMNTPQIQTALNKVYTDSLSISLLKHNKSQRKGLHIKANSDSIDKTVNLPTLSTRDKNFTKQISFNKDLITSLNNIHSGGNNTKLQTIESHQMQMQTNMNNMSKNISSQFNIDYMRSLNQMASDKDTQLIFSKIKNQNKMRNVLNCIEKFENKIKKSKENSTNIIERYEKRAEILKFKYKRCIEKNFVVV
jgi:hypothetical protein